MKLSYEWLSSYIDLDGVSAERLGEVLTQAGLEVEGVEPRAGGELSGVVVGLVAACEPHPNADKLRVCQVDVGDSEPLTIVCGAPNVAVGQKVPVAVPGSVLPGGPIGVAKLRGIESHGMLCSAKEIGLEVRLLPKEQTTGLYVLPDDARVGDDVASLLALDDWVLDISLTPNRSDCLSMRGLAHEVSALLGRPLFFTDPMQAASMSSSAQMEPAVHVRLETEGCPRYAAQALENIEIHPSPLWMQMRLLAMGVRPINNIVDITNYVMFEWGQPLHAFDLDQVHGGTIVVRQGRDSERLTTLDGEERELTPDTIVIADEDRAIGIAGVMGGENSEVRESTHRIVLESAIFQSTSVRRTGARLGLRSEAQQRFEKGIDPVAVYAALGRATELFQSVCGARVAGAPTIARLPNTETSFEWSVTFSPSRANRLLGTNIAPDDMRSIFERLGFTVQVAGDDAWQVKIPSRRPDITIEADLIEEVARVYGYDAIPSSLPTGVTTVGTRNPIQRLRKTTREALTAAGMFEVFPYTFTEPSVADALRLPTEHLLRNHVALMHPMSEERSVLRTHLLPGLAHIAAHNLAHGQVGGQVFEIGRVYLPQSVPPTQIPDEPQILGCLWFGEVPRAMGVKRHPYDFYDAKGILETWLASLGCGTPTVERADVPWLHPGRSATVSVAGQVIGSFGELHPETAEALSVPRAIYAEFALEDLLDVIESRLKVHSLPRFPAIARDLAVLVPKSVAAGDLVRTAVEVVEAASCLEDCHIFDVYEGKGVPDGQKSVAVAFVYRWKDRTMTDAEVSEWENRILDSWKQRFSAELRAGI